MLKIRIVLFALAAAAPSFAAAQNVKIGVQTGIGYLPLQIMVHEKLLEKHAKQNDPKSNLHVELVGFANANAMTDALLSGAVQYASGGVSTFLSLWARAEGANAVKSNGALVAMPMYLNTRNPAVKSIKDFTEKDRIGVAGVKVSYQAMLIQMAAAKEYGDANYAKLDPLTVAVSNPNGVQALSNPRSEINTHFTPPPFAYWERKIPGVHTVLKSYDILGGPSTLNQVWSRVKFAEDNPALHRAFWAAFQESTAFLNANKKRAAEIYLLASGDKKSTVAEIQEILEDPEVRYGTTPERVMPVADFMSKVGAIKRKAGDWKELYYPELHSLPGN